MKPARPTAAGETGGAFGDLGTLLPILLGAVAVAGMSAGGVLVGFGVFLMATRLIYRLPLPVQPMKAVGALVVAGGLAPGEVAAAGIAGGLILLALTLGGATAWAARVVPGSAILGLQLGVGATMAWIGVGLAWGGPLSAGVALALLVAIPRLAPRLPAVPLALLGAVAADLAAGSALPALPTLSLSLPQLVLPASLDETWRGLVVGALPQLPLTLANAVLLPALLAREMFPPGQRWPSWWPAILPPTGWHGALAGGSSRSSTGSRPKAGVSSRWSGWCRRCPSTSPTTRWA